MTILIVLGICFLLLFALVTTFCTVVSVNAFRMAPNAVVKVVTALAALFCFIGSVSAVVLTVKLVSFLVEWVA